MGIKNGRCRAKMGKKSKRRGGTGGGKKSRQTASAGDVGDSPRLAGDQLAVAAAGLTVTPADALALLETVQPLPSLKGIISTNDDPGKCAMCLSPTVLIEGVPGVRFSAYCLPCCGKRLCSACEDADCGFALDLLGEPRCTFCNALKSSTFSLCLQEATTGMAWAQYFMGFYYFTGDSPNQAFAFDYMVKAASQGHPKAFLVLSTLCRGNYGHPRDLMSAQAFAKKARSLHLNLRLLSNMLLVGIAKQYFEDGAVEEASAILTDVAKEADPNALDGELCDAIASLAYRIDDKQFSGEMRARAFCLGEVQSAYCASSSYFVVEHYALSKLWLSVACKTKSGFRYFMMMDDDGTVTPVPWSFTKLKERRDWIRSKLREISDSCGGCGAALEGDERKYCRGCKAFCYCSRDCQKMHWNRTDGGHRAECKEAQDQARKILEAIQSGNIDLSKKN